FDAVGTLIFPDPPVHLAYYRIGRKYGSKSTPSEVLHRFRTAMAAPQSSRTGSQSPPLPDGGTTTGNGEELERRYWRGIVGEVLPDVADPDACFEELFAHFAHPASWQCFADVEETLLEANRRGHRLALASNFD